MQTLCPKCGQPAEDGLCPQCRMNSIRLIQFPDVVEVVICSVCGSQQIKGKWQFPDSRSIEDLAAGAAADSVWLHHEFIHPNIEVDLRKVGATRYIAGMRIRGSFMEQPASAAAAWQGSTSSPQCSCEEMAADPFPPGRWRSAGGWLRIWPMQAIGEAISYPSSRI